MTLTRTYGRGTLTFNINDLDNNTKIILMYDSGNANSARDRALSIRGYLQNTDFADIETTLQTLKSQWLLGYYDCVSSATASGSSQITSSSSYLYLSMIVCSKNNDYTYTCTFNSVNVYSQLLSQADEEDTESRYLTNELATGNDFNIDVAISSIPMGFVFGNIMSGGAVFDFDFSGSSTPTVTIDTDLTNCDLDNTTVDADTATLLTLTSDSVQYLFYDIPTITINGVTSSFTVSQDKRTATFNLTASENDVITVSATAIFKYINISTDLTDCTISNSSVEIGDTITLTLYADNGLGFYLTPTITINGVTSDFTVSQDKETATFNYTGARGDVVSVYGVAVAEPKTATIDRSNITNVSVLPNVNEYTEYSDLTLIFTCDNYHNFSGIPYIDTNIYDGYIETIQAVKVNDREYRLTLPKTAFYTGASITYSITVYATAIFDSETVNKYGLVCLYKPTKQNLIDLSKVRFVTIGETDTTEDLGKYITSLKRIYLDVSTVEDSDIILGGTNTNIKSGLIDNDEIIVNLGNATITGVYNNELDIKHSTIELVLPFIDIVTVDSARVMNRTINIKYKCNLITGVCIAYIYLVENETLTLLYKFSGVIGFDVPYILKPNDENIVNNSNVNADNIFNAEPKINIYMNEKADENNSIYNTFYIDRIENIASGFVSVNKILSANNSKVILDSENRLIENALKTGFII